MDTGPGLGAPRVGEVKQPRLGGKGGETENVGIVLGCIFRGFGPKEINDIKGTEAQGSGPRAAAVAGMGWRDP